MEIILKTDIPKLGNALDIVEVKDGYARNFLFPGKMAIPATKSNKELIIRNREKMQSLFAKEKGEAEGLAAELKEASVSLSRKVIEEEKIFGSVTSGDIAEALKSQGFKVEKRQVFLEEAIKQLGVYTVTIRLQAGIEAPVKVWVVAEEE
jgi:large subunit ribosomal protein L9